MGGTNFIGPPVRRSSPIREVATNLGVPVDYRLDGSRHIAPSRRLFTNRNAELLGSPSTG